MLCTMKNVNLKYKTFYIFNRYPNLEHFSLRQTLS